MTTYNILLALTAPHDLAPWISLSERLLPPGGEIHLRGLVRIEAEKSISEGATSAREWRDVLYRAAADHPGIHDEVQVYVDHDPFRRVVEDLARLEIDLLLVQQPALAVDDPTTERLLQPLPCDVVVVRGVGWEAPGDVLLSLRGGPNISIGLRVAEALADGADITLFHAADNRRAAPDLDLLLRAVPTLRRTVTAVTDIADGIVAEAAGHKAIVMGSSFRRDAASGPSMAEQILARTGLPIILVRGAQPEALAFHAPQEAPTEDPLSLRVDRWFAENTFHSSEFDDLPALLALKEKQGLTISLALPALNEEATVGQVITTLKRALMDEVPLVDEIVLIDSASDDRTVEIARACGVPVYIHQQILSEELGAYRGKGEALWKSLLVTKGDLVAWIDTDITNIHPRFIYGLIGPLLKHPRIQFVKGFYARPIKVDGKLQAFGGGRVTELVARPLLNLFYPELSGIVQPLSGEYAGRRAALEAVPFFTGYGVETGLLLDLLASHGLDAIAQSDLEIRVHHNQPLVSLSKMAFAILQVFIARLESRYGVELLDKTNRSMKLIIQEPERFGLEIAEIGDAERPPIASMR